MRRAATVLASVGMAVVAVVVVIAFFSSRDEATTAPNRSAPGVVDSGATDPLLRNGNVEILYSRAGDGRRLRKLAEDLGAPDTPALRAAGQAVVLRLDAGGPAVRARAFRHSLRVASAADPRLQDFVEAWLGAAASG